MKNKQNKPFIETMINTCALVITTTGTTFALNKDYYGFILIIFGASLEWFKYYGRQKKLW